MKKLIIAGSSKLQERAAYWRGYFEGRGYEVIDFPSLVSDEGDYASNLTDIYVSFYQNIDRTDVFFLMNEDKDDIGGYIGPSAFAELTYAIIANLNRGKKIEIHILQMPSPEQPCHEEVKFWLDQNWLKIYDRPTGKKAAIPAVAPVETEPTAVEETSKKTEIEAPIDEIAAPAITPTPAPHAGIFHTTGRSNEKTINIIGCRKRCLRNLSPAAREYLRTLSPEFPAWLLKYIAAPEFQRLSGVSTVCGIDHSGLYNFQHFNSVFSHSIGVALIVWRFTHDKKQTLAGLFHDIASPAFKHCVDFMNGDSESQESTEARTGEIIRNSRVIMRQLKRDGILASEISDYHLYPIADNDVPGLAADRLEYSLSNCLFLYETLDIDQVQRITDDLVVLKNENDIDEIGFHTPEIAELFVKATLPAFEDYRSEQARATMQFIADVLKSMEISGSLTNDDLYNMSEREVIDWILSCGEKPLGEAFRQFQRATSVYTSPTAKKDRYCTSVKAKVRYCVPLVVNVDTNINERITDSSRSAKRSIDKFLAAKPPKYVGFDFEFTPYSE